MYTYIMSFKQANNIYFYYNIICIILLFLYFSIDLSYYLIYFILIVFTNQKFQTNQVFVYI